MIDIKEAFKKIKSVHDFYNIQGKFVSDFKTSEYWPSNLPVSPEIESFYSECNPENVKFETGLTSLKFLNIESLESSQVGYRWTNTPSGKVLNADWPQEYLVIFDDIGGGKPIIALTNIESTPVYASYDVVLPFKIAESLSDFLMAFSEMINIVYGDFDIFDVSDDDGVNDRFLDMLANKLKPILGESNFDRYVDYCYG